MHVNEEPTDPKTHPKETPSREVMRRFDRRRPTYGNLPNRVAKNIGCRPKYVPCRKISTAQAMDEAKA